MLSLSKPILTRKAICVKFWIRTTMNDDKNPLVVDEIRHQLFVLAQQCSHCVKRISVKLEKRKQEEIESLKAPWYRTMADSLLADTKSYPRGSAQTDIINIHTDTIEQINLNPQYDAAQNAQLLYKKARKAERGTTIARQKVSETQGELNAVTSLMERVRAIAQAGDESIDIQPFLVEAMTLGIIPKSDAAAKSPLSKKIGPTVPYRHFVIDGVDVYIGKNDAQNDELSTRFAKPWFIWMHVAACAGSHVVIRREKGSIEWPSKDILTKAAALAVWFSKAKHTTFTEVHATEARFVRKRRGSPPGQVAIERYKTIRVAPKSPHDMFGSDYTDPE